MAEAYQLPPIPDAPAGIRIKTLLKLRGDWICLGYVGSKRADTAYGFAPDRRVRAPLGENHRSLEEDRRHPHAAGSRRFV